MPIILIIDDDQDIADGMKLVLKSKNYTVDHASSGDEGLKMIKDKKPDLIILDVMMETGDKGFDIARELKKSDSYKNIPILMLTAVRDRTGLDFKSEAGDEDWLPVDEYCDKPLDPELLITKVENLLRRKQ